MVLMIVLISVAALYGLYILAASFLSPIVYTVSSLPADRNTNNTQPKDKN